MTPLTEITPEERAQWRKESRAEYAHFSQDGRRLMRALNALDAAEAQIDFLANVSQPLANLLQEAEARAEKAEAERDILADVLKETGGESLCCLECPFPARRTRCTIPAALKACWIAWAAQEVARQAAEKKDGE